MKITIESTSVITTIEGVKVRLWEGTTERGAPCKVFVRMIAAEIGREEELERELLELPQPAELRTLSLRQIL